MTRSPNIPGISMNIQMMKPDKPRGAAAGFTLLELLLAVFIFSVIATIVYGSFQSSFNTVSATEETAGFDTQARLIFERIESDILSIRLEEQDCFWGETSSVNGSRGDTLEFCSSADVRLNRDIVPSKVKIITYSAGENDDKGFFDLYRQEKEYADNEADEADTDTVSEGVRIGRNVREFRVDYLDAAGDELENWERASGTAQQEDETETAPKVVKILISFGSEESENIYLYRSSFAVR